MTVRFNVCNWHSNHKFQSSGWFHGWIRGLCDLLVLFIVLLTLLINTLSKKVLLTLVTFVQYLSMYVCDFGTAVMKMVRVDRLTRNKTELPLNVIAGSDAAYSGILFFRACQIHLPVLSEQNIYEWCAYYTKCSRELYGQQFSRQHVNKADYDD